MSEPAIAIARVCGVTQRYGAAIALNGVTLDVPRGRLVGLIGPDGVGKSSLLAIVAGARHIQSGEAFVLGGNIADVAHRGGGLPAHRLYAAGFGQEPVP